MSEAVHEPSFLLIAQIHQLQAMLHLGMAPDPRTGQPRKPNAEAAAFEIELLRILQKKTAGNLTEDESRILSDSIEALGTALEEIAASGTSDVAQQQPKSPRKRRIILPGDED